MSHSKIKMSVNGKENKSETYLLFAGAHQVPRGGLGDLVQSFDSGEMARSAFRDMRLKQRSAASWAQLAVVDANGIQPLCWFGIGATPSGGATLVTEQHLRDAGRRRRNGKRSSAKEDQCWGD